MAILEITPDAAYEVFIGSNGQGEVHVFSVTKGATWAAPIVTFLSYLPRPPWAWGQVDSVGADRTPSGKLVAVVRTSRDPSCNTGGTILTCGMAGGAQAYLRSPTGAWSRIGALKPPAVKARARCGLHVAVVGDLVVVGCSGDSSTSQIVGSGESTNAGTDVGSVHTWRLNTADATLSVREGYLKAYRAASNQFFGWSLGAAANATHELVAAGAYGDNTGAPYGSMANGLAMPYDVALVGTSGPSAEGAVWTFTHVRGSGNTWAARHRLKAPVGVMDEDFGETLSVGVRSAGGFVLGIGTYLGCKGYLVTVW